MPLWTATNQIGLKSLRPVEVITGIVMTNGQQTAAVALPPSPAHRAIDLIWYIRFASNPPGAVDYQLEIAPNNVNTEFVLAGTAMTTSEITGGQVIVTNIVARFARVVATDADSVAPTISIMVM